MNEQDKAKQCANSENNLKNAWSFVLVVKDVADSNLEDERNAFHRNVQEKPEYHWKLLIPGDGKVLYNEGTEIKRINISEFGFVRKVNLIPDVMRILSEHITGKTKPLDICLPIRAAMDTNVIRKPSYNEFCSIFGSDVCDKSSYDAHLSINNTVKKNLDYYESLKREFMQLLAQ